MNERVPDPDRTRIAVGMVVIAVVILAAAVTFFLVDAPAGKALMLAIVVTVAVRGGLLIRSLRRPR